MKKLLALALATALLATSLVTGPALGAATKKFATHVTINFTQTTYSATFKGKVKSDRAGCRKKRKVLVFRKNSPNVKIASTKSNKKGKWHTDLSGTPPPGDYFAKAKKKTLKNGTIVCKKGKSPTITVP